MIAKIIQHKEKVKKLSKLALQFFSFQILIQGVDALTGLIIVRNISKVEYAYFGIAGTISVSALNVIISGMSVYFLSEGVKIKSNPAEISMLLAGIKSFLKKKVLIVVSIMLPITLWMLNRNGLELYRATLFFSMICIEIFFRLRVQLLQSLFNIYGDYNVIQRVNLISSLCRVMLIFLISMAINGEIAYLSMVVTYVIQFFILKRKSANYLEETKIIENHKEIEKMWGFYKTQLPTTIYAAVDGQVVILILTFFGNTLLLADYSAASKLNLIMVAINVFINNYVIVQFAKVGTKEKFKKLLGYTIAIFFTFYCVAIFSIMEFPKWFIFLIGPKFENIEPDLYWVVIVVCFANFSGLLNAINSSKLWIKKTWIAIPLTISTQCILLATIPPKSLREVWLFALCCSMPSFLINVLFCIRGISKLSPSI